MTLLTNSPDLTRFHESSEAIRRAVMEAWRVPPQIGGTEWAQKNFVLSSEYAGSAAGRFRPIPYQVEILDAFVDPLIPEVYVLKSSRVGYTIMLQAAMGYWMKQQPMRQLMVQPTDADAKDFSKDHVGPMLRDIPVLQGLVQDSARRDNTNTLTKKAYPGGILHISGASAPSNFRRIGVDKVLLDEIDGYPACQEGDQTKLAEKRAMDSPYKKVILGSTPTEEDVSKIEPRYAQSDMRVFLVPCPHCGTFQEIEWERIRWPHGKPHQAIFECERCCKAIEETKKLSMLREGRWHARRPEIRDRRGYFVWAGYSTLPNARWCDLARDFLESKDDPTKKQVFWNTTLGRSWKHYQTWVEASELLERRENYGAEVPDGVLLLAAGVDVQEDRLEVEVAGFGVGEEAWNVDYRVFWGDPNTDEPWNRLDELLFKHQYVHESGSLMSIAVTCIDSGGHHTDVVYEYCDRRRERRVWGCIGRAGARPYVVMPGQDRKAVQRAKRKARKEGTAFKYMPVVVGVDGAKTLLYSRLALSKPGPGYCHFPVERDEEYFKQLTAERWRMVHKNGKSTGTWVKVRERNEALDCRVLAVAGVKILNPLWNALQQGNVVQLPNKPRGRRVRSRGITRR